MDTEICDGPEAVGDSPDRPFHFDHTHMAEEEVSVHQWWWLGARDEDLEQLDMVLDQILEKSRTSPAIRVNLSLGVRGRQYTVGEVPLGIVWRCSG